MRRILQIRSLSTLTPTKTIYPNDYLANPTNLASILQNCIDSNSPKSGQSIHSQIIKSLFQPNTTVSIKLLILHIKCGSLFNARNLFDRWSEPTISSYSYLISGYFKQGLINESLDLVRRLTFTNQRPDGFTLSMVLKLSAKLFSLNFIRQIQGHMVKLHFEPDNVLFSALIDSYVKLREMNYARNVFDSMPHKNVFCATSLVDGYMNEGLYTNAQKLFDEVHEKDLVVYNAMIEGFSKSSETAVNSLQMYKTVLKLGFKPNISTFVSILGACSMLSDLDFGSQIHCQIIKSNLFSHIKGASALIDFYSKCGCVNEARQIFDKTRGKNVISWTSMIDGYGRNGFPNQALKLFDEMIKNEKVKPNPTTFLTILSCCGHNGLVSKGKEIFQNMERNYAQKPDMEHYSCMVDLLGRNGELNEAYELIKNMKNMNIKPSVDVWAALLGACRIYGNLNLAKIAAKEVFELSRNQRPGAYLAFSNILAESGKWERVCEVRELMKQRGVEKDVGNSEVWS